MMSDDPKPFTYDYFRALMARAKEISSVTTLKGRKDGSCVILRHDVDFDISLAYEMALVEEEIGIRSTFFIMATCQFYNAASSKNREYLIAMSKKGFEIGLHFDPTIYGNVTQEELAHHVDEECSFLENVIGRKIVSISLHNPSVTGKFPMFEGYNNAYSDEVFSDVAYLSDSCMNFRDKDPFIFIEEAKKRQVQIVFHPLHWSEAGGDYVKAFSKYIRDSIDNLDKLFQVNPTYKDLLNGDTLMNLLELEAEIDE